MLFTRSVCLSSATLLRHIFLPFHAELLSSSGGLFFCADHVLCFCFVLGFFVLVIYVAFLFVGWLLQLMEEKKALKALHMVVRTS